jgi:hypothetical protein
MKNVFTSKTIWVNLTVMILGFVNQDFLISFGVDPKWQLTILAFVNLALRFITSTGLTVGKSDE